METLWWIYEVPDPQAAFIATFVADSADLGCAMTGVRIVSRTGIDDREHLYFCMRTDGYPLNERDVTLEVLSFIADRRWLSMHELLDSDGLRAMATGRPTAMMAYLLWLYPGQIQISVPEGTPRIIWSE